MDMPGRATCGAAPPTQATNPRNLLTTKWLPEIRPGAVIRRERDNFDSRVLASAQLCQTNRGHSRGSRGRTGFGYRLGLLTTLHHEVQETRNDDHDGNNCNPV
jgi:hypothetical protein